MAAIAERKGCEPVICLNKCDLEPCEQLYGIYHQAGFTTIQVSAVTGEGIQQLSDAIAGKNGGLYGQFRCGQIQHFERPGSTAGHCHRRGQRKAGPGPAHHRHVELFRLPNGALVADTPGFASFDTEVPELLNKEELALAFGSSTPYLGPVQICGLFPH